MWRGRNMQTVYYRKGSGPRFEWPDRNAATRDALGVPVSASAPLVLTDSRRRDTPPQTEMSIEIPSGAREDEGEMPMRISRIVLLVCGAVGCGSDATPAKDGKGPDAGDAARSEAAAPDGSGNVATAPDVSQGSDAGDAPGESSTGVAPDGTGDATLDGPAEPTTDRSGDVTALGDASGDGDTGANNLQNWPVMTAATLTGGSLNVIYSVPSLAANSAYPLRVEFFKADSDGIS